MIRLRVAVTVLAGCLLGAGLLLGQDKPPPAPIRGTLPPYYKRLGLRDDQRQNVYKIRAAYRAKLAALRRQLAQLRDKEQDELERVLTPEQLKRLRELRSGIRPGRRPAEKPKPKDKSSKGG